MTKLFDKLNLRPQERRFVVFAAVAVFVVLNVWVVRPRFGDVGRWQQRARDADNKLKRYQEEVDRKGSYEKEIRRLESQGLYVASQEQALQLQKEVSSHALEANVLISRYDPRTGVISGRTNAFFDEQALVVTLEPNGEKEIVDFLYKLASRNALIRVHSLTLMPDPPSRTRLRGSITFVESFQRKAAPKASPAATVASTPAVAPLKTGSVATKPGAASDAGKTNQPKVQPKTPSAAPPLATNLPPRMAPAPVKPSTNATVPIPRRVVPSMTRTNKL